MQIDRYFWLSINITCFKKFPILQIFVVPKLSAVPYDFLGAVRDRFAILFHNFRAVWYSAIFCHIVQYSRRWRRRFAQIQIYIQDGMCRLEPARTGTMFSDGCWGLSPHVTDCNQLQVSIFPQFPSMQIILLYMQYRYKVFVGQSRKLSYMQYRYICETISESILKYMQYRFICGTISETILHAISL